MNNEKQDTVDEKTSTTQVENSPTEHPLPVHNPLDPNDSRQITQEDIENEQKYKQALTDRD